MSLLYDQVTVIRTLKFALMKNLSLLLLMAGLFFATGCKKDSGSERFSLLTSHVWLTDDLLADGVDASGPGQILEKFKGEVKFNEDGSGYFGQYDGTWRFVYDETSLVIESVDLPVPLTTYIDELTKLSLKVSFNYPNQVDPTNPLDIIMTFIPK